MPDIRITTFNVENLFNRYAFLDQPFDGVGYEAFVRAIGVVSIANRKGELVPEATTTIQRNNTALAIEEAAPDILAVQEVEDVYSLRIFNEEFLSRYFRQIVLVDGNDPRGIDVGFLVRDGFAGEIVGLRSHVDDAAPEKKVIRETLSPLGYIAKNAIFSRDCLEVDVRVESGRVLTFLVNHFKAQDQNAQESAEKRRRQAARVSELATAAIDAGRYPIVVGDLNVDARKVPDRSLDPLLGNERLVDPFTAHLGEGEQWTHYYDYERSVSRLDYALVDRRLDVRGVEVVRKGLSTKCKHYVGPRFSGIGPVHTEASDHCPVTTIVHV
jgi:endonuclease/exonuclease/phosphatase family metal-dependent hydrolase